MQIIQTLEAPEDILLLRAFEQGQEPANQNMFKAEKGEIWWYSSQELWFGLGKQPKISSVIKAFRSLFLKGKTAGRNRLYWMHAIFHRNGSKLQ
ncbi:hypothetical protein [Dyadobacter sp. NIV53]|uniref:hypothetical protein n=1 Tax=Dyadobacter sp. NIV53 TaxID=2861765 RepID=UPI001E5A9763|nr:hypothetical protein [Dyadobacter sp. NIV53]